MDKEYSSTTDREVYVNTTETVAVPSEDSGTGWAVALVVLILAIGFGFVAFSNNQSASELRTTQQIEDVRRDNSLSTNIPAVVQPAPVVSIPSVPNPAAVPQTTNVEVKVPAPEAPAPAAPVESVPAEPAPVEEPTE
ncbi:MAG: hypothetical protein SGJ27_05190 [Candidatus Melainabacteria bacterium]|nr:hypothetical protein [Candidatus Melainabacteria bacterium]